MSTLPKAQPADSRMPVRPAAIQPESFIERFGDFLEAHRFAALGLVSAVYFAGAMLHARAKPFWNDEIYTVLISGLPDLHSIWRALAQGLDGHPPFGYLTVRAARMLPLDLHIAARIPAMIGFWVFCLCLFRFVRRRMGIYPAFAALLLPFATGSSVYSVEARPYGQVLGFVGMALVFWQIAADGEHRRWTLPALAVALAGTVFSHYEAGLIFGPFCGAELFRDFRRRKIDWGIWIAFLAGLVPVLFYLPFLAGQRQFMGHPWARPHVRMLLDFYETEFRQLIIPGIAFLACAALYYAVFVRRGRLENAPAGPMGEPRSRELVIAALFAALPVAGMAAGYLVTHMFTSRYVIATAGGVVLLAVMFVARVGRGSTVLPALLVLVAFGSFLQKAVPTGRFQNPIDKLPLLREAIARGPIAIEDPLVYFETWYYLPPEMKSRVFFPVDLARADRYLGTDTPDRALLLWKPWANLSVPDYRTLVSSGKSFLLYHHESERNAWLRGGLVRDGAHLEMVAWDLDGAVFRATFPAPPASAAAR